MKAIIYKPTQNAMQSGTGFKARWVVEFEKQSACKIDGIMGWNGTSDMDKYVRLKFSSFYDAEDYVKRNDISYTIIQPNERNIKPKSYAANFQ